MNKASFQGKLPEHLSQKMLELQEPKFRAMQIFEGLYKHRFQSWEEFSNLPKSLRETFEELEPIKRLKITHQVQSIDGTQKFTIDVGEGKEVEAVWIPSGDGERKTICISSQVGCTLNCSFCATAKLEFSGNLSSWQILSQVLLVEEAVRDRATNIVFMGMGEPMHNYFHVLEAAHILNHPSAFGLGAKRITISTAGVVPGIHRFIDAKEPFTFAISLNHPDPKERSQVMDINEKHSLEDLLSAAKRFTKELKRPITFEYVMIPGVNMRSNDAQKVVQILRSVENCKINVIPLNTEFHGWRRPTREEVMEFIDQISVAQVPVLNRNSPGKDIGGACGMLAYSRK